jgi:hypothetical protein
LDQHGRLALDHLAEQLDDVAHRRRLADDLGERMVERGRRDHRGLHPLDRRGRRRDQVTDPGEIGVVERRHLGRHRTGLVGRADDRAQPVGDVVERPAGGARPAGVDHAAQAVRAVHRRRDDDQAGVAGPHHRLAPLRRGEPGRDVGQDGGARRRRGALDGLAHRVRRPDVAAAARLRQAELQAPPPAQQVPRDRHVEKIIEREAHLASL